MIRFVGFIAAYIQVEAGTTRHRYQESFLS